MTDIVDPATRSRMMASIKGSETQPERVVRSFLFRCGFRFKKNVASLPGKPDVVLPKYRTIVLVHGCFWHQHPRCRFATVPQTNKAFWVEKLEKNKNRDRIVKQRLRRLGWRVLTHWECQLTEKQLENLVSKIRDGGSE